MKISCFYYTWARVRLAAILVAMVILAVKGFCWEDHPDIRDFSLHDELFANAQSKTNASEYELKKFLKEQEELYRNFPNEKFRKEDLSDFRDNKFKRDQHERN